MKEVLLRVAAPATIFVVEVEAPTRVVQLAASPADIERLALHYHERPERAALLALALEEAGVLDGGAARGKAWSTELGREGAASSKLSNGCSPGASGESRSECSATAATGQPTLR